MGPLLLNHRARGSSAIDSDQEASRCHGHVEPSQQSDPRTIVEAGHALQRSVGNRATAMLLGGGPSPVLQLRGSGRAKKPPVAPAHPADAHDKAGTGPGNVDAEPFTDAQLERMGQAAQVNVLFHDIEKLKDDRLDTWKTTASRKEPKPMREALDIVVASVALGMGGVFGMIISKAIKGEYLKDFVYLAGLEAVDKITEDTYHYAMSSLGEALQRGTRDAASDQSRQVAVTAALSADKDDLLETYAEAMRLQARTETSTQQQQFNLGAKTTYRRSALLAQGLALKVVYDQLLSDPQVFHRELTVGLIRLLDEHAVAKKAEDYGGDKQRAWKEDSGLHDTKERKGNLLVLPEKVSFSLGSYERPDLNFGNYYALATGANTKTLSKLANTPVKDLPLSLGFRYWVEDPFYRIVRGGMVKAWFTRDPSGGIYLDDLGRGAKEWLASYHSGLTRELTDDERDRWAPMGAMKLYEATKDRPITTLSNSDIL